MTPRSVATVFTTTPCLLLSQFPLVQLKISFIDAFHRKNCYFKFMQFKQLDRLIFILKDLEILKLNCSKIER